MSEKEGRLFPDQGQQFVQIIRGRSPIASTDPHGRVDGMNQTELRAVDQFPFLAFFDSFDGQSHLLGELIEGAIVEV